MKANELMTGDWVKLKNNHCKSIQLTAIDETYNSIIYFDGDAEGELTLQLTAIEPIPLTPEILEKNGFERTTCGVGAIIYTFSDDDEYYALAIDEYADSIWRVEYTNCEMPFPLVRIMVVFVHELQHALRLCGIEKEIVL